MNQQQLRELYTEYFDNLIDEMVIMLETSVANRHKGYIYENILSAIGIRLLEKTNKYNNLFSNPVEKEVGNVLKEKDEQTLARLAFCYQFSNPKRVDIINDNIKVSKKFVRDLTKMKISTKLKKQTVTLKSSTEHGDTKIELLNEASDEIFNVCVEGTDSREAVILIEMVTSFAKMNGWDVITEGEFMEDLDKYDF